MKITGPEKAIELYQRHFSQFLFSNPRSIALLLRLWQYSNMLQDSCNMAFEILRHTNDGDALAPEHLGLLELAVNNRLNNEGMDVFRDLYDQVLAGTYQKSWLHGVEHPTRDHKGYVYWREHQIEHWSENLPWSDEGKLAAI